VSAKVLREQLRQMLADDLIARREFHPIRLGVRYQLTPYGHTLGVVFETLWRWGRKHVSRPHAAGGTIVMAPRQVIRQEAL